MTPRRPHTRCRLLLLGLILWTWPTPAGAQLISPGKLSAVHGDLDGITNCTRCHDLGERGVSGSKCLGCHEPLALRMASGLGLHGRADATECGDCHKEHLGVDFRIVRFDTTAFDHRETGWTLAGAHRAAACRSCHKPSFIADPLVVKTKGPAGATGRTYLGLDPRCEGCHESDDPHGGQFTNPECSTCHDEAGWKGADRFAHAATRFPLTGRHRAVACVSCHASRTGVSDPGALRYADIPFATCASCHRDPHAGRMGPVCSGCHQTDGWSSLIGNTFGTAAEHSRTGFDLVGAHFTAPCSACHTRGASSSRTVRLRFASGTRGRRFPAPAHETCVDCHLDAHAEGLPMRGESSPCTDCHSEDAWTPSSFAPDRHASETRFALTGSHVAVACSACHVGDPDRVHIDFRSEGAGCASCHQKDDPHAGQFADEAGSTTCENCHATDDWSGIVFDHTATRFQLAGRHATTTCKACHKAGEGQPIPYRGLDTSCSSCHGIDDPHGDQFGGRPCADCHDSASFRLAQFDHDRTRFPLDRTHANVACGGCHAPESDEDGRVFVRFRPIDTRCSSCHAS